MRRMLKIFISDNIPRWVQYTLLVFVFLAIFRNFIANDIPLYSKINNNHYFPILEQQLYKVGVGDRYTKYHKARTEYKDQYNIYPPIPYHGNTLDIKNTHFVTPFGSQKISSWRYRHFLGTDQLGRDILARIIHGTMTALRVALLSSLIALIIGLLLGLLAGYYQDDKLKSNLIQVFLAVISIPIIIYYSFYHRRYVLMSGHGFEWLLSFLYASIGLFILYWTSINLISKNDLKRYSIPMDLIIMRLVEAYKSIPLLLLIFVILALFEKPSLTHVIWVIGLTRWTTITRYVRAEVLHIRNQEYITAAISTGLSDKSILWNHVLPNAISPIVVTIAFSMSSAILLEATLSFLGIGIPVDTISWGSIIQASRNATHAWWVAIFPGMAIFLLVLAFNKIAEKVNE